MYDRTLRFWLTLLVGISLLCATACVESNLFVVTVRSDWVPGQDVVRIYTQIDGRELHLFAARKGQELFGQAIAAPRCIKHMLGDFALLGIFEPL